MAVFGFLGGIIGLFTQWIYTFFSLFQSKSPKATWRRNLRNAQSYREWHIAADQLDAIYGFDKWRNEVKSKLYGFDAVLDHLRELQRATGDHTLHHTLPNLIRSALTRNMGNITSTKLYHRAFGGTKHLIEQYVVQFGISINKVLLPDSSSGIEEEDSTQGGTGGHHGAPMELAVTPITSRRVQGLWTLHDKKTAAADFQRSFGNTCLILQGGSIFGMCHLGVVKALHEEGLLPRCITGTATGALIAALVATHTDEELPRVFSGELVDLSAFETHARKTSSGSRWSTLFRRVHRFITKGYVLDLTVLEQLVRDNVGEMTFQEAFERTGRALNITVVSSGQGGVPTVLNYLSTPNVLIWTAAAASNADLPSLYGRTTQLLRKGYDGRIQAWGPPRTFRHFSQAQYTEQNSPIRKIGSQFNVNHYIVSQARAYMLPFLRPDMHGPVSSFSWYLNDMAWYAGLEVRHRLRQLDRFKLIPGRIRRLVIDDVVPSGRGLTVVPDVKLADFARLLEVPTQQSLAHWIRVGEKSVWPALAALRVRCHVELVIQNAQDVLDATNEAEYADLGVPNTEGNGRANA
ncbi:hypothetical protein MCOR25_003301 [Pyricularia grisea]|uniref:PNPLA domain-containing protein n=1 Tax=Pyricularia grisea TaxID=148305 RepID=A0A6P8B445_PYRGI|nr:hypothetical protein PgNI_06288 [Pyricularia grisea]KAI6373913.1 hypothetical protein MCOR25_003301 [Pyricularia grisea]TLD10101.1 hypothetical protein PgNI_06288 [Pyricularia grisea]